MIQSDPRTATSKRQLLELCKDPYDNNKAITDINHTFLLSALDRGLSLKAQKLLKYCIENIQRRNLLFTSNKELSECISDSKHMSKYLSELIDKRYLYVVRQSKQGKLLEIHPALAYKGWYARRDLYLKQWLSSSPIYISRE